MIFACSPNTTRFRMKRLQRCQSRKLSARLILTICALISANSHAGWQVAPNLWRDTRPLYACDADCVINRERGKKIGRVVVGEPCDGQLSPAWQSRGNQWQFVNGGVAVCEFVGDPEPVMDICMQICTEEVGALCE